MIPLMVFVNFAVLLWRGVPKHQRLQHHILRNGQKYINIPEHSQQIRPTSSQPLPPSSPPSQAAPPSYTSRRNAVKPKPVICKKKRGECTHVIAFGEHFNKTAWKAYSDFLSTQQAETPIPDEMV